MLGAFPTIKPPGPKNKARQIFLQEPLDSFLPPPREDANDAEKKKKLPAIGHHDSGDGGLSFVSPFDPQWARQPDRRPPPNPPSFDYAIHADTAPASSRKSSAKHKTRQLPKGLPPNYIGAGRPVTPTPPRAPPHAYAALRRSTVNRSGDAASCALPHASLFADVRRGDAAAGLDLTGWLVHDSDLPALAQCAW